MAAGQGEAAFFRRFARRLSAEAGQFARSPKGTSDPPPAVRLSALSVYVLDTNVLSQVAPTKTAQNRSLSTWLRRNGDYCYLSVVSVAEFSYGASWLARKGASRKSIQLQAWIRSVLALHRDRILDIDEAVAVRSGELMATGRANGAAVDIEDALIAASADLRGMTVLTDNVRHFAPMAVAHLNPLRQLPPDVTRRE
jgi:predicted nucleic acid-binding protein